ncbi:MAG: DUF2796 domain-containing protein [Paracoccaceae bacterium]
MPRVLPLIALALPLSSTAFAETRQLDAHEHGSGTLNIAIEGNSVAMELEAPGFDIVGFEYEAKSDEDKASIEQAMATLSSPLALFTPPAAAGCSVTEAHVKLLSDDDHEDHDDDHDHDDHADEKDDHDHDEDHDEDGHDDHDHDEDHAEDGHDDHDHDEDHAEDGHDDHEHDEDHAEDGHDDHDHGEDHAEGGHDNHDHDDEARHTAFFATYQLTCEDSASLTQLDLPYFQTFPNAQELDVQLVTDTGASSTEATRDEPVAKF